MGSAGQFLGLVGTSGSAQDEMKGVFGMDRETGDFGAASLKRAGDRAGLGVVTVEGERLQRGRSQVDRVPFEDKRGLCSISKAEDGRRWSLHSVCVEDSLLERLEGGCVRCFGGMVARDVDVDNASRRDVTWKQERRKFDLDPQVSTMLLDVSFFDIEPWITVLLPPRGR